MKLFATLAIAAFAVPALAAPAPEAEAAEVSHDKRFLSCKLKGANCRAFCASFCYKDTGLFTLGQSCFLGKCKCFTPDGRKVRWPAWEVAKGNYPNWPSACHGGCNVCEAQDWYDLPTTTEVDPEA
ncbi:uncharacterized protein CcaverHIS019_0306470 [Cutaneotrichosporon cavernicola]|uniref:Uncharacterized protein n=1 Tax=Cutaneotrichosporon cavernicola TaxID=279322 RepID=A0AA48L2C9_9TREE|nr:uncharacterized protein CcaverHIS019_0306470 [Cutaneotrichosporon cavernicola]BEI90577.1 hypothetical protein CcaverHIS019_0306470 [Cutaneotrichosporon cavernicola]BEI98353.1 hypothetical protein CcaverHIS631_0306520 [Cutaneotrichosporon cavernicola]BEJ06128.1 hypothetical protein CcaverHIS641_0306500 [Cutaneotrichosporon cavernicola]